MNNITDIVNELYSYTQQRLLECKSLHPQPNEYLIFLDQENNFWYILLLYEQREDLLEVLENGTCYYTPDFFWKRLFTQSSLQEMIDFKNSYIPIVFEVGTLPKEKKEFSEYIKNFLEKRKKVKLKVGLSSANLCSVCGHPSDNHFMVGPIDEGKGIPLRGWMTCKEEDYICLRTWDVNGIGNN